MDGKPQGGIWEREREKEEIRGQEEKIEKKQTWRRRMKVCKNKDKVGEKDILVVEVVVSVLLLPETQNLTAMQLDSCHICITYITGTWTRALGNTLGSV